ncbi:MAG: hypothetical protein IJZ72_08775 [Oscillospiraceae bacterium]|nr:hypothetical protein [Oscillospiraceae bacterium]
MNRNDQEAIVQKIRSQYMEKDNTQKEIELLHELDAEVKRPAKVFGYVFGSASALIMGAGMSFVMTDVGAKLGFGNTKPFGIIVGAIGMIMAVINYPMYSSILESRKDKYASRILALSKKIMNK